MLKTNLRPMAFLLLALSSNGAFAQAEDPSSMATFRKFVQVNHAERASLLSNSSVMHIVATEGKSKGEIVVNRVQNQDGITFTPVTAISGSEGAVNDYTKHAFSGEIDRFNACKDPATAASLELSETNYTVKFIDHVTVDGVATDHYRLTPIQRRKGLIEGDMWINPETGHVIHEIGKSIPASSFVKELNYDRAQIEKDGEIISTHQAYHAKISLFGLHTIISDTTVDFTDVKITRKAQP